MTRPKKTHPEQRKQFSTDWFQDLDENDDKELRAQLVQSAGPTLQILAEIVKRRKQSVETKYEYSEAWQFEIARDIGRKQELDFLLRLLTPILIKE